MPRDASVHGIAREIETSLKVLKFGGWRLRRLLRCCGRFSEKIASFHPKRESRVESPPLPQARNRPARSGQCSDRTRCELGAKRRRSPRWPPCGQPALPRCSGKSRWGAEPIGRSFAKRMPPPDGRRADGDAARPAGAIHPRPAEHAGSDHRQQGRVPLACTRRRQRLRWRASAPSGSGCRIG
jgi:hypothetical protein